VTIAAAQALYRKVKDDEAKIAALQHQLAKQMRRWRACSRG
jgi:hypothetical protein